MVSKETATQPKAPLPASSRLVATLKVLVGIGLLIALVYLGRSLGDHVPRFAAWVEQLGFWGPVVFILGYTVATVAFIPGSFMTLAAGAVFGLVKGTIYVFVGATLGASAAFLVARYLARARVQRRVQASPKFQSIDRAVGDQGRKIVFLLRLSPVFPFNLLNYGLGLTKVRFLDYLIACIGMIPGTFLYVYYGKAAGTLAALAGGVEARKGAGSWVLLGFGLLATVAVTAVVTRIAKKALSQEVTHENE